MQFEASIVDRYRRVELQVLEHSSTRAHATNHRAEQYGKLRKRTLNHLRGGQVGHHLAGVYLVIDQHLTAGVQDAQHDAIDEEIGEALEKADAQAELYIQLFGFVQLVGEHSKIHSFIDKNNIINQVKLLYQISKDLI